MSALSDGDIAGLEDGEILSAVKLEPCCSDDDDSHDCKRASVGRHTKRFLNASVSHDSGRPRDIVHDGLHNSSTDTKLQSHGRNVSVVTRNAKRSRLSKDRRSSGQPGTYRYGIFAGEFS